MQNLDELIGHPLRLSNNDQNALSIDIYFSTLNKYLNILIHPFQKSMINLKISFTLIKIL